MRDKKKVPTPRCEHEISTGRPEYLLRNYRPRWNQEWGKQQKLPKENQSFIISNVIKKKKNTSISHFPSRSLSHSLCTYLKYLFASSFFSSVLSYFTRLLLSRCEVSNNENIKINIHINGHDAISSFYPVVVHLKLSRKPDDVNTPTQYTQIHINAHTYINIYICTHAFIHTYVRTHTALEKPLFTGYV